MLTVSVSSQEPNYRARGREKGPQNKYYFITPPLQKRYQ